jgi:hypothetical protein
MPQAATAPEQDRRLTLAEVIDWLGRRCAHRRRKRGEAAQGAPLLPRLEPPAGDHCGPEVEIAQPPHRPLMLEHLTEWLARRVGLEYLHIDPLKMDFSAVTEVMSSAYATRFRILPVGINTKEVVVATAEPWERGWERELRPILKVEIRRVIANPLDIERYQVEFYNLAKSVKGATRGATGGSGLSNFEQLVELGSSNKPLDANDAHIVRVVDWLWSYAFEQRASDIISSRGAKSESCASGSTAFCTRSTRSRPRSSWR